MYKGFHITLRNTHLTANHGEISHKLDQYNDRLVIENNIISHFTKALLPLFKVKLEQSEYNKMLKN